MADTVSSLLLDLIIGEKTSVDTGLYIDTLKLEEGISKIGKARIKLSSQKVCLRQKEIINYLDKQATILFNDENGEVQRTFTGKITSVKHLGTTTNIANEKLFKYEFVIENNLADMCFVYNTEHFKKYNAKNVLKKLLSNYYGEEPADFVITAPDVKEYDFFQKDETDYDFFLRILTQFGLSYYVSSVCAGKNKYKERIIISDGASYTVEQNPDSEIENHYDREYNLLSSNLSLCKSNNTLKIDSWEMENSNCIDSVSLSRTQQRKGKRPWFLNSFVAPHCYSDENPDTTRERIAENYLNSLKAASTNWNGVAHVHYLRPTDLVNLLDFYSEVVLDNDEKIAGQKASEDNIRGRIITIETSSVNNSPNMNESAATKLIFRCAEVSNTAPTVKTLFACTNLTNANAANEETVVPQTMSNSEPGINYRRATVCDSNGNFTDVNHLANIFEKSGSKDIYFKAYIDDAKEVVDVLFTMPIGGSGQGLFRFPRIGDKILIVATKDSHYILQSYIPNNDTMEFRNLKRDANQMLDVTQKNQLATSTILRHTTNTHFVEEDNKKVSIDGTAFLKTEDTKAVRPVLEQQTIAVKDNFEEDKLDSRDIKYSEIGMYSGEIFFDEDGEIKYNPEILKVQTPGNQYNHSGLSSISTANRFVFSTPNNKKGSVNFVDIGSLNICARKEINLIVGGSSIKITPSGITLLKKSTTTSSSEYDSSLKLTQNGVTASGYKTSMNSIASASMSSGYGESVKLSGGKATIKGIRAEISTLEKSKNIVSNLVNYWDFAWYAEAFIENEVKRSKRYKIDYNKMVETGCFSYGTMNERLTGKNDEKAKAKKEQDILNYKKRLKDTGLIDFIISVHHFFGWKVPTADTLIDKIIDPIETEKSIAVVLAPTILGIVKDFISSLPVPKIEDPVSIVDFTEFIINEVWKLVDAAYKVADIFDAFDEQKKMQREDITTFANMLSHQVLSQVRFYLEKNKQTIAKISQISFTNNGTKLVTPEIDVDTRKVETYVHKVNAAPPAPFHPRSLKRLKEAYDSHKSVGFFIDTCKGIVDELLPKYDLTQAKLLEASRKIPMISFITDDDLTSEKVEINILPKTLTNIDVKSAKYSARFSSENGLDKTMHAIENKKMALAQFITTKPAKIQIASKNSDIEIHSKDSTTVHFDPTHGYKAKKVEFTTGNATADIVYQKQIRIVSEGGPGKCVSAITATPSKIEIISGSIPATASVIKAADGSLGFYSPSTKVDTNNMTVNSALTNVKPQPGVNTVKIPVVIGSRPQ